MATSRSRRGTRAWAQPQVCLLHSISFGPSTTATSRPTGATESCVRCFIFNILFLPHDGQAQVYFSRRIEMLVHALQMLTLIPIIFGLYVAARLMESNQLCHESTSPLTHPTSQPCVRPQALTGRHLRWRDPGLDHGHALLHPHSRARQQRAQAQPEPSRLVAVNKHS